MLKKYISLVRKSFTLRRFWNVLKITISYGLSLLIRKPIVWGYPPIVMIEPTNICNLQCPLCPSGAGKLSRERGYMSLKMFKKIVDEIEKYSFMILLWNQGEPFLNPNLLDMIEYAHAKKLYIMTSSNANILPSAKDIVNSGLDMILISLDGATQETYDKYRQSGSLENVVNNVRELVKAKKEMAEYSSKRSAGKEKPRLQIVNQFLVMKHNEHEIDRVKQITKELEFDATVLKTVQIYTKEDITNYLPKNPKYRRYKVSTDNFELKYGIKNRCFRIWSQPVINWNGDMSVCCFDKDIEYSIGNIKKAQFYELWKSKRMMLFRQIILKNRKLFEFCRNCGEGVSLTIKDS